MYDIKKKTCLLSLKSVKRGFFEKLYDFTVNLTTLIKGRWNFKPNTLFFQVHDLPFGIVAVIVQFFFTKFAAKCSRAV